MFDITKLSNFTAGDAVADLALASADVEMRTIDPNDVIEHPDNRRVSQSKVDRLKVSFLEEGMAQPPTVRIHPQDETMYQHISGWHRILAYRELYRETGDERWARIPVVLLKGCDDETALRLMWQTNLIDSELSDEERGRGYEVLAGQVDRMREEDPELYRGKRTNEVVSEMLKEQGIEASPRTVARKRQAVQRAAAEPGDGLGRNQEPTSKRDERKDEAMRALSALASAVERIERTAEDGFAFDPEVLHGYRTRIRRVEKASKPQGEWS